MKYAIPLILLVLFFVVGCSSTRIIPLKTSISPTDNLTVNSITTTDYGIINGNLYIGGKIVNVNGINATGNIIPAVDSIYSLGNSTKYWKNTYSDNVSISERLGIGTTVPLGKLQIGSNMILDDISGQTHFGNNVYFSSGWKYVATGAASAIEQSGGIITLFTVPSGTAGAAAPMDPTTQRLTIINNGNVGIGTTAPGTLLQVGGATTTTARITVDSTSATEPGIVINNAGVSKWLMYRPANTNDLRFYDYGATDVMTLKAGGNVGIGTTNPASIPGFDRTLQINSATDVALVLSGVGGHKEIGVNTAGDLQFYDGSSLKMVLQNSTGNVGIGTTNPVNKLDVRGDTQIINAGTNAVLYLGEDTFAGTYGQLSWNAADDTIRIGTQSGGDVITATEGGNVGIGTTTPQTKLDVNSTTIRFRASDNSSQGMCLNVSQSGTVSAYKC